ncbi:uncharacterized protein EV422DRAFT_394885 [Fimicolochytrium jonesii]|uniref:uncharacterized protein n=1 Tax=Fimicolochytrium jonesii TaxID=1396493 RepID=UPI0022FE046A|nr:uncharacterized protein EV422DRAFT_394885 [Fimicolochytrium jonesii]KAI8823181.1 hypothetical protein EV422DRAFT_394885 [Fimicolochytrium jonesii]
MAKRKGSDSDGEQTPARRRRVTSSSSSQGSTKKEQKTMDSFFKKDEVKKDEANGSASASHAEAYSRPKITTTNMGKLNGDFIRNKMIAEGAAGGLHPIKEIPDMFYDLVNNCPAIAETAEALNGRPLRVATMCSGTESPLLALDMVARAVKKRYGVDLRFEHVFSCEIEPFKQAYIERNFAPPLLFRDVCELGDDEATTAYGALREVPGNVDLLVAGTSCVDFSNLNNKKKNIDEMGESGRTFKGMLRWVDKHRPAMVILENVVGADWEYAVKPAIEALNYRAQFDKAMDTKHFYIPHTRQRGYLFAISKDYTQDLNAAKKWHNVVKSLTRPFSMPLEAFLLETDDPRVHAAREQFIRAAEDRTAKRGRLDWERCQGRHQKARYDERLGKKRPMTAWEDGSICTPFQFAWPEWGRVQPERVLDLMDIMYLRQGLETNVDACYKTIVWNLSQNVDRNPLSKNYSITPCLTPSMIAYITTRGGPLIGREALSLQGIIVDELLLTRETEDQLADLAGNAMSTTVVGTCILSALVAGREAIKKRQQSVAGTSIIMEVDADDEKHRKATEMVGESQLVSEHYDLVTCKTLPLLTLLKQARNSARLCDCEGREMIKTTDIQFCKDCGNTACLKCGKRPEHNYDLKTLERQMPAQFEDGLKGVLPMRVSIDGFTEAALESLKGDLTVDAETWSLWRQTSTDSVHGAEFRFRILKRQQVWIAIYETPRATLELLIDPIQPEWRLTVNAPETDAKNSPLRRLFEQPVARMRIDPRNAENFLGADGSGQWELNLPAPKSFTVTITGEGELVPSWKAHLGILANGLEHEKWWSRVAISDVPKDAKAWLDRDITGTYVLLDKCGTAMNALHRLEEEGAANADEMDHHPLFMFLDPTRSGDPKQDTFVFSTNNRRLAYLETRSITAALHCTWRPSDIKGPQKVKCNVNGRWVQAAAMRLNVPPADEATFALAAGKLEVDSEACDNTAVMLLKCSVPLTYADSIWPVGEWTDIELQHKGKTTFGTLAWITERLPPLTALEEWMTVGKVSAEDRCQRCAPTAPALRWLLNGNKATPVEDPIQAGPYEQALKHRPQPFVAQLKCEGDVGMMRVGANIATLLHRAHATLTSGNTFGVKRTEPITLSWRLTTEYSVLDQPRFVLSSNRADSSSPQPPHFTRYPLRPEQLRSLSWMLAQEKKDVEPFYEEEIEESVLEPLRWRVAAKAERPVRIRGGVLADEVGYGKTAITLGLIDASWEAEMKAAGVSQRQSVKLPEVSGAIPIRATLIVVPPHLSKQWPSEIRKFTDSSFKVIAIENLARMNKLTIAEFQSADIIVVASRMLNSQQYWERLAALAGDGPLPVQAGRRFNVRYESALEGLKAQTDRLKKGDVDGVRAVVDANRNRDDDTVLEVSSRKSGKELMALLPPSVEAALIRGRKNRLAMMANKGKGKSASKKRQATLDFDEIEEDEVEDVVEEEVEEDVDEDEQEDEENQEVLPARVRTPRAAAGSKKRAMVVDDEEDEMEPENEDDDDDEFVPPTAVIEVADEDAEQEDDDDDNESEDVQDENTFEVECFLQEDVPADGSETRYLVKWKGYPKSQATWEPYEGVKHLTDVMEAWERRGEPKAKKHKAADIFTQKKTAAKAKVVTKENAEPKVKDTPKAKAATNAKVTPKTKPEAKKVAVEEDEVDEFEPKAKRAPAKPKTIKPSEVDPWHLRDNAVKRDWRKMACPALEMFHFDRVVIDEYTYLENKIYASVTHLRSSKRWILSGTPPLGDFNDIKSIANFLGVHLGADDTLTSKRGQNANQSTAAERFLSFREVHTPAWHSRRHQLGQLFLDKFVRQNLAEIDEIPAEEHLINIQLPAAERAIYLELEHHLQAMEMDNKKTLKTNGDRERRLREAMGSSKTAEEALLKRCSHFDLRVEGNEEEGPVVAKESDSADEANGEDDDDDYAVEADADDEPVVAKKGPKSAKGKKASMTLVKAAGNAREACEIIVKEREKQLADCTASLQRLVVNANEMHNTLRVRGGFWDGRTADFQPRKDPLHEWQQHWLNGTDVGDVDAVDMLHDILKLTGTVIEGPQEADLVRKRAGKNGNPKGKGKPKKKTEVVNGEVVELKEKSEEETLFDLYWDLREVVHKLRRLVKELVGRVRSLRYFKLVRDLQKTRKNGKDGDATPRYCHGENCLGANGVKPMETEGKIPLDKLAVLSCCGHVGCEPCLRHHAGKQECPVAGCEVPVRLSNVVLAKTIGHEKEDEELTPFGKKLSELVKLINGFPEDDRVLVFIQFDDLMGRVGEALDAAGIGNLKLQGTTAQTSSALEAFQQDDSTDPFPPPTGKKRTSSAMEAKNNKHTEKPRVLLLNVMNESASGANLTIANHAIFLSPLLTESQQEYTACETQAIGRVRRYGQEKCVHIWRFLTENTMDTQIFEERERTVLR